MTVIKEADRIEGNPSSIEAFAPFVVYYIGIEGREALKPKIVRDNQIFVRGCGSAARTLAAFREPNPQR